MVAQPTVAWRIDQLEAEGQRLLSSANDVAQRDAAKGALAKIDRFAAIFRRYQWASAQGGGQMAQVQSVQPLAAGQLPAANQPGSGTTRLAQQPNTSIQQLATSPQSPASSNQPQYDAVGLLRPVVSQRPGAPQYALVNDQGQVVSFVTPAPDLNLQPYLGRRIGIVGGRGYIPEFQRAHVTRVARHAARRPHASLGIAAQLWPGGWGGARPSPARWGLPAVRPQPPRPMSR